MQRQLDLVRIGNSWGNCKEKCPKDDVSRMTQHGKVILVHVGGSNHITAEILYLICLTQLELALFT